MKGKCKWVKAEQRNKNNVGGWNPYITSLCNGESIDDAISRIKRDNPQLEFRNFELSEH